MYELSDYFINLVNETGVENFAAKYKLNPKAVAEYCNTRQIQETTLTNLAVKLEGVWVKDYKGF